MSEIIYDILIIGSGPAGMTASVYASRAGAKVAIIEASAPGGKMVKTHLVENFPSFESISGVDLSMKMNDHSLAFGTTYEYGNVTKIEKNEEQVFLVHTEHGAIFYGKSVIVATGTVERKLGLQHEDELVGKGVSYCAVCDGAFFKGEDVIVIGGGNSALDESLYLTEFVNSVTIVIRRDVFRADASTVEKIQNHPKVKVIVKHLPKEIIVKEGMVAGLEIEHVETKETQVVTGKAIFPYIGADPVSKFVAHFAILDESGYINVDKHLQTSIPGLFAAGDIVDKELRQIVTATSDGAIAAQSALKYLLG